MRLLVYQHVECEGLGAFRAALDDLGVAVHIARTDRDEGAAGNADSTLADGLVILGGPMNVDQTHEHPFLADELLTIRNYVRAGCPVLGICLGAQLLAKALGAGVYPARVREIGAGQVSLTGAGHSDCLFSDLPDPLPVFQWHGDTFNLPEGSVLLAAGSSCCNQAFRFGDRAWGVQFHLEATPEMVEEWTKAYAHELGAEGLNATAIVEKARQTSKDREPLARIFIERFVEAVQKSQSVRAEPLEA